MTDLSAAVALPDDILQAARRSPAAVGRAIGAHGGTPLRDGGGVTLLYHGIADAVHFQHWMDVFPDVPDFLPIPDTKLWWLRFELDRHARIEYKIVVERLGRRRVLVDKFNPEQAANPWGANSVLAGADYTRPAWTLPGENVARGTVELHVVQSTIFGGARTVHLYVPSVGDEFPLLVVHDGFEYLQFTSLPTVLDNLIAAGDIPPVAAVLINPFDRFGEYRASDRHAEHVVHEVLPMVDQAVAVTHRVAMGASLGAVASLHAAWTHPATFDGLVLQGGSFVTQLGGPHRRGPIFQPVVNFMDNFMARPGTLPSAIHLSCGLYDGLTVDNQKMASTLKTLGVDVGHAEIASGHDWHAWRDLLREALAHTLNRI